MTRIGRKPIDIKPDVKITQTEGFIVVEGPQGKLILPIPEQVVVKTGDKLAEVAEKNEGTARNIHGLFRSLLSNAIVGVVTPWTKSLELVGVGYRAQTDGKQLELNLGFSHPVKITAPEGITFKVAENKIIVTGVDKYLVGEEAAKIHKLKPPEPYKGKGIRYEKELIRKKLGKAAKAVGGAAGAK